MSLGGVVRNNKAYIAKLLSVSGVSRLATTAHHRALRGRFVRAVNYHGTPSATALSFERQLARYAERYVSVSELELMEFLNTGDWRKPKPGLVLSFDDGFRSNYDVARPLLEKYGFIGWFFVPSAWPSPGGPDPELVERHGIKPDEQYADGRTMMSRDEICSLARHHVVGCHTRTHHRLGSKVPADVVHEQVAVAREELRELLGREIETFCWVGGEEKSYSAQAARAIRDAGYRLSFMTNSAPIRRNTHPLQLQRTNIESNWPVDLVELQLSGLVDLIYARKRRRVNRLTLTPR